MRNISHKAHIAIEKPNAIMLSMQSAYWNSLHNISNNLSNASTYGFKSSLLKLEQAVHTNKTGSKVFYTKASDMVRNTANGSFHKTGNPLDLCLNGSGYFMVETPRGKFLTRNGQFTTDINGTLITAHGGFKVLDQSGSEIKISVDTKNIAIDAYGTIIMHGPYGDNDASKNLINNKKHTKIGVFSVKDEQLLKNIGDNLLSFSEDTEDAVSCQVLQGGLEESNVSPMEEGIRLINVMRSYENAQKLIEKYEQARHKTLNVSVKGS